MSNTLMIDGCSSQHLAELLLSRGYQLISNDSISIVGKQTQEQEKKKNSIMLDGVKILENQKVKIEIAICSESEFYIKERIFEVNKMIHNFEYILKIQEQILIEEDKICIHIYEDFEESLDQELSQMKELGLEFREKQIIALYLNMIYSLIELCSLSITHGSINPTQIFRKSDGSYKLLNGANLEIQEFRQLLNTQDEYVDYVAPELKEGMSQETLENQRKNHLKWQRDVYSMGLCFLRVLQLEINQELTEHLFKQSYCIFYERVKAEYKTLLTFIIDFMIQFDCAKRDIPYRLRRTFIYFYTDLYIKVEEEFSRMEEHIKYYLSQQNQSNIYLANQYLVLSQTFFENRDEQYITKSLQIINQLEMQDSFEEALYYLELGIIQLNSQKYSMSLSSYQKSLELQEKILGDSHILVAYTNNKLALVYFFLQNQELSFEKDEYTLKMRQILFHGNHSDIADSLSCVGFSFLQKNEYTAALEYSLKSYQMRLELFNENHPDIASSLEEIGITYTQLRDHEVAHEYYEKSLIIRKKIYSQYHNEIAKSYDSLAVSFSKLGKEEISLQYDLQALKIRKMIYPNLHPKIARSINNIAISYLKLCDYHKALEFAEESYGIRKQIFPDLFPDIAESLSTLGSIHYRLTDYEKAINCYKHTLSINLKIYTKLHDQIVDSYQSLAQCYKKYGEVKLAIKQESQLLKLREIQLTRYHPDIADSCDRLAHLYSLIEDFKMEQKYYSDALVIRKRLLDEDEQSDEYIETCKNLALNYLQLGQYSVSKEYFLRAFGSIQVNQPCTQSWIGFLSSFAVLMYQMKNYDFSFIQSKTCLKLAKSSLPSHNLQVNTYAMNHAIISAKIGKSKSLLPKQQTNQS